MLYLVWQFVHNTNYCCDIVWNKYINQLVKINLPSEICD